jgi:hypothetical protein
VRLFVFIEMGIERTAAQREKKDVHAEEEKGEGWQGMRERRN